MISLVLYYGGTRLRLRFIHEATNLDAYGALTR